jgi:hypothetical protein
MASYAPSVSERFDDRETSATHRVTACMPRRDDGCAIVAVAYLDAKPGIADGDLQRDRFDRMHDRVRDEFRHNQAGLVSHLRLDSVRVQEQSYVLPCASRRFAILAERQFQMVACRHDNPLTAAPKLVDPLPRVWGQRKMYTRGCARSKSSGVHKRGESATGE